MTTRSKTGAGRRVNYRSLAGLKPKRSAPKVTKVARKAITSVAKRVWRSNTETKFVTSQIWDAETFNSGIGTSDIYRVLPNVPQAVTEIGRVGDRLMPTGLYVKGTVAINRDALVSNNKTLMVRLLVLRHKSENTIGGAVSAWSTGGDYASLLRTNTETGVEFAPFSGFQRELMYPVNRERFEVLGERFIKLSAVDTPSVESGGNMLAKTFNFKIRTPKSLHYNRATDIQPTNYAPFVCLGYAYMDGTIPDVTSLEIISSAQSHLYYKDA